MCWLSVDPALAAGAGSAKLSYVLLQKLLKLSKFLPRRGSGPASGSDGGESNNASGAGGFCFKYVITDFSHANFGFWMNHPRLQELFTLGIIDFAVFDAEAEPGCVGGEQPGADGKEGGVGKDAGGGVANTGSPGVGLWGSGCLRLELSGEELRPGDLDNPVIVVANYVFDSLKQDAFRYGAGCDGVLWRFPRRLAQDSLSCVFGRHTHYNVILVRGMMRFCCALSCITKGISRRCVCVCFAQFVEF